MSGDPQHPTGVDPHGQLVVRKYGTTVRVTREWLVDSGLVQPTAEEQAKIDLQAASFAERKRRATIDWDAYQTQLAAVGDPVARVVLDLHAAVDGWCHGCELNGYEAEYPTWPCQTTTAVAAVFGIEEPPDLWMAEQGRV